MRHQSLLLVQLVGTVGLTVLAGACASAPEVPLPDRAEREVLAAVIDMANEYVPDLGETPLWVLVPHPDVQRLPSVGAFRRQEIVDSLSEDDARLLDELSREPWPLAVPRDLSTRRPYRVRDVSRGVFSTPGNPSLFLGPLVLDPSRTRAVTYVSVWCGGIGLCGLDSFVFLRLENGVWKLSYFLITAMA